MREKRVKKLIREREKREIDASKDVSEKIIEGEIIIINKKSSIH